MKKYLPLLLLALLSSGSTLLLFRAFAADPPVEQAKNQQGDARYVSLVERLLTTRSSTGGNAARPTDFVEAAAVATPAVVNIRSVQESSFDLWGRGSAATSTGSGVILTPDGYVVTNHHVVDHSKEIKVTLADKRSYFAELVGSDPSTDIALLKIKEVNLPFMLFGDSDSIQVGEWVLAVGNPFNLESTVTTGIVSAKGRNINILGGGTSIESFIQTDAVVNPGNSGGALVNTSGALIGINTAIISESGSYAGYSFAVPSNLVQKVIRDLREFGIVQRAFLGIGIEEVDSETAMEMGLPSPQGVYVNRVSNKSAADEAGLAVGDVILGINGVEIRSTPELQEHIGRYRPGDKVKVSFWRNGRRQESQLTLKDGKNATAVTRLRGDAFRDTYGFELRDMNSEERQSLGIYGARVSSVLRGSLAGECQIRPGFVITSVNGIRVTNMAEAMEAIHNAYNSVILDGYYEGERRLVTYQFRKR